MTTTLPIVGLVQNQFVGAPKCDVISLKCGHQAPHNHARLAGDVVWQFVDDVVAGNVEEVLAIHKLPSAPLTKSE